MIRNLQYSKEQVSWNFRQKEVNVKLNNVIFASEDKENNYIRIDSGENFETKKVYLFDFIGNLLMSYDIEKGHMAWKYNSSEKEMDIQNLLQVGYFPQKNMFLTMYQGKNREVAAFDLNGDFLFEVIKPEGFEMMYFQEFKDYVSVVCDGDDSQVDKFGRRRFNFQLNADTGYLTKEGLAY
ncbi:hypothetical protein [Lysinibacillus sp. 54212]|uniref:hypothetical protein n=1 Tax=Lysinibacillus sp. 54212 TaxID=3119829 RepID=UPI002FC9AB70